MVEVPPKPEFSILNGLTITTLATTASCLKSLGSLTGILGIPGPGPSSSSSQTYLNQPATDEKQFYVEPWVLVDDVYNSMSSDMANPNLTEGRRFICKHSAIGLAYEEFREHRFAHWTEPGGMEL